jgi:hypothetical protein
MLSLLRVASCRVVAWVNPAVLSVAAVRIVKTVFGLPADEVANRQIAETASALYLEV